MTSAAAKRMKAYRQREAAGRMVLQHVEIDLVPVADMLIGAGLLDPLKADDRRAVEVAVEKLLTTLVRIEAAGGA